MLQRNSWTILRQAIVSSEAKDKFGKYPSQTEFIRGVIYQWIRKQTPHILIDDLKGRFQK